MNADIDDHAGHWANPKVLEGRFVPYDTPRIGSMRWHCRRISLQFVISEHGA
ncbi:hypothetical protein Sinac_5373 [Singulisphaera acidiphila DSM 18658]|uniref:Uncharacterized protein n=1 Tax=Singulisphaera acidiphila (strain ATCC BAA-1392 / DSM 18658 / VKM B-2454 / MOB10) TaxID=886293 RepID=L0DLI1_SINAD|nr:hypothetical protein Sinac_5373 [Singulisphaera acidiphila DSM 18658]